MKKPLNALLVCCLAIVSVSSATCAFAQNEKPSQALAQNNVDQAGPSEAAVSAAKAKSAQAASAKPKSPTDPSNDPNAQPSATPPSLFAGFMDPFDYDPRGRRDPFGQPIADKPMAQGNVSGPLLPLQQFDLRQLRLTGIIWNVNNPKAMIKDPGGVVHVVGPNAKIGPHNGYVAVIREGEIVVVETMDQEGHLVSTAQVVRIAK